jgi:exonuclease VII small subunit
LFESFPINNSLPIFQANIDKHKRALKEIDVAQQKITSLTKQKAKLQPKFEAANEAVEGLVKQVEHDKTCYIEVRRGFNLLVNNLGDQWCGGSLLVGDNLLPVPKKKYQNNFNK